MTRPMREEKKPEEEEEWAKWVEEEAYEKVINRLNENGWNDKKVIQGIVKKVGKERIEKLVEAMEREGRMEGIVSLGLMTGYVNEAYGGIRFKKYPGLKKMLMEGAKQMAIQDGKGVIYCLRGIVGMKKEEEEEYDEELEELSERMFEVAESIREVHILAGMVYEMSGGKYQKESDVFVMSVMRAKLVKGKYEEGMEDVVYEHCASEKRGYVRVIGYECLALLSHHVKEEKRMMDFLWMNWEDSIGVIQFRMKEALRTLRKRFGIEYIKRKASALDGKTSMEWMTMVVDQMTSEELTEDYFEKLYSFLFTPYQSTVVELFQKSIQQCRVLQNTTAFHSVKEKLRVEGGPIAIGMHRFVGDEEETEKQDRVLLLKRKMMKWDKETLLQWMDSYCMSLSANDKQRFLPLWRILAKKRNEELFDWCSTFVPTHVSSSSSFSVNYMLLKMLLDCVEFHEGKERESLWNFFYEMLFDSFEEIRSLAYESLQCLPKREIPHDRKDVMLMFRDPFQMDTAVYLVRYAGWKLDFRKVLETDGPTPGILRWWRIIGKEESPFENEDSLVKEICEKMKSKLREYFMDDENIHWRILSEAVWLLTDSRYVLSLLLSLRHAGAYTAVYQAYLSLCYTEKKKLSLLMEMKDTLLACLEQGSSISTTQKSAGLPLAMLALVLSQEPCHSNPLLQSVIDPLLDFCQHASCVSTRIHSFHCLQVLAMESKLRSALLPYLSRLLQCAFSGFSYDWRVRSAAHRLFASLLTVLFGSKKANNGVIDSKRDMTASECFTKFSGMYSVCLSALQSYTTLYKSYQRIHPGLYPLLILFSRFSPSYTDSHSTLVKLLMVLIPCHDARVRQMLAYALYPLVDQPSAFLSQLQSATISTHNYRHALSCFQSIFQ